MKPTMTDPTVLRIQDWLREHENELLQDTLRMLQIPSVQSEPAPGAPFGSGNRAALDFALKLANDAGMETKDLEGYIGYAEIGSGDRLILSLGHLDVVPVGDGWKHEPFGAQVEDGYIYARGAVDDKGPTMASFYAVKAIQAVVPDLPARIRQVFGCNEESGFACVHRYAQVEEPPTYGIAPDSSWPLVHAEKGIASLVVTVPLNLKSPMQLLELTGGQRPNIVIDAAGAKVRVHSTLRAQVEERLKSAWDKNVGWEWEGDVLSLTARGKAAHGMQPFKGDNAATRMLRFLVELSPLEAQDYFESLLLSTDAGGVGLGIHGRDDASGDLTSNLGLVATGEGNLTLTFNVRYPTTWKGEDVRTRCESHLRVTRPDWKVRSFTDSPSLYFPLDHPLVQAIRDVYTHETGDNSEPGTTGGGTYARALPNTVSIGTGWAGDGEPHENDERLKIEHLFRMARIYAHILYRLATMT